MTFDWRQAATGLAVPKEPVRWVGVSKRHPCPICEHPDWCGVSEDGRIVRCMRVESDHAVAGSDGAVGWIHKTSFFDKFDKNPPPSPQRKVYTPEPTRKSEACALTYKAWLENTAGQAVVRLAWRLGVTLCSLRALGAAWATPHRAWAFPMRDETGKIVGLRLRSEDGDKWAVSGSRQGLFYDPRKALRDPVLICEGPTDTAALLDLGFCAVGRPSCRAGGPQLEKLLAGREAVIVADRDEPHQRPDGSIWYPGQEGAADLAGRLTRVCISVKVIQPPKGCKDARDWVTSGATAPRIQDRIRIAYEW
jgi:hypothetical protein